MTADTRIVPFPGPTEPRHTTEDPAWPAALLWLRDHPEGANVSSIVLAAYLAGARGERHKHEEST